MQTRSGEKPWSAGGFVSSWGYCAGLPPLGLSHPGAIWPGPALVGLGQLTQEGKGFFQLCSEGENSLNSQAGVLPESTLGAQGGFLF